jgi:TetR/AcrR family transcriptional regulator, transcriptional repressor for nem operon
MTKENTRDKILEHAARIMQAKGFNNTGIQEILQSAGVPKGSFYFYFRSKDELGLALIDYYAALSTAAREALLKRDEGGPLERLKFFFESRRHFLEQQDVRAGCPIGNLTQEMGIINEAFRTKLRAVFDQIRSSIAECLKQAQELQEIAPGFDPVLTADFILNSWEGALLRMKAEANTEPLVLFENMVFDHLLKR